MCPFQNLFIVVHTGNIVVDGVAASVYNTAMGGEARMHAFTGLGRALWRRAPALLRWAHSTRAAQPLSLAIGRFFSKVLLVLPPTSPLHHCSSAAPPIPCDNTRPTRLPLLGCMWAPALSSRSVPAKQSLHAVMTPDALIVQSVKRADCDPSLCIPQNLQPATPGNPALHWAAVRLSSLSA